MSSLVDSCVQHFPPDLGSDSLHHSLLLSQVLQWIYICLYVSLSLQSVHHSLDGTYHISCDMVPTPEYVQALHSLPELVRTEYGLVEQPDGAQETKHHQVTWQSSSTGVSGAKILLDHHKISYPCFFFC